MKKKILLSVLVLSLLSGVMTGCSGATDSPNVTDDTQATVTEPERLRLEKTSQIKEQDTYTTIEDASLGYDNALITDDMIAACTLPEATVSDLPYWTGFVLENKMLANVTHDDRWDGYSDGVQYWYEGLIDLIAQEGFNCARCMYSLTYLGNPNDPEQISENALAELDALISWGLKYNVHIMLSITATSICGIW